MIVGSEFPRIVTAEQVPLTPETTLGFDCIEFAEQVLRVSLNPWQKYFIKRALEILPDGSYRYRTVLLLVARQSGKSLVMTVVALYMMLVAAQGELVLGTAQDLDTSEGTWGDAVEMVEAVPALSRLVKQVVKVNGKKSLVLANGSKWKVAAAKRTGGRGKSAGLVLLDELREHLNYEAWNAITNTTIARREAQVWGVSNAGDAGSIVLKELREKAIAQKDDPGARTLICEWSAPDDCPVGEPGVPIESDPEVLAGVLQANPSVGHTVTLEAIEASRATSQEAGYRTENLCQWVTAMERGPFDEESIEACVDLESVVDEASPLVVSVDTARDRSVSWVAVAGWRPDGVPHVEVIARRAFTDWVPAYLAGKDPGTLAFRPAATVVQGRGCHASSLIDFIEDADVPVTRCEGNDLTSACGQFFDRIVQGTVRFGDEPALLTALREVVVKNLGDAFVWNRDKSPVDVAPLCAATFALWGLVHGVSASAPKATAYGSDYGSWWEGV